MFTQMHVHPSLILLNHGVHLLQQALVTHYCHSTAIPNGYHQHTFNHKPFIHANIYSWAWNCEDDFACGDSSRLTKLNPTTNWTDRTERSEFLRCVIIHCWEPEAFGTVRESVGRGRERNKERYGIYGRQGDKRKMAIDQETKKRAERRKELRVDRLERTRCMKQRERKKNYSLRMNKKD